MVLVVESRSNALAVMPTAVPMAVFSSISLAASVEIRGRRDIEFIEVIDGDCKVLRCHGTVAGRGLHRDGSRRAVDFAVNRCCCVTTPVLASIVNRPSRLLVSE